MVSGVRSIDTSGVWCNVSSDQQQGAFLQIQSAVIMITTYAKTTFDTTSSKPKKHSVSAPVSNIKRSKQARADLIKAKDNDIQLVIGGAVLALLANIVSRFSLATIVEQQHTAISALARSSRTIHLDAQNHLHHPVGFIAYHFSF